MTTGGSYPWSGRGKAVSGDTYGKSFDSKTAVWYKIPVIQSSQVTRIRLDPDICQLLEQASQQKRKEVSFTDKETGSYYTAYLESKLYMHGNNTLHAHLERVYKERELDGQKNTAVGRGVSSQTSNENRKSVDTKTSCKAGGSQQENVPNSGAKAKYDFRTSTVHSQDNHSGTELPLVPGAGSPYAEKNDTFSPGIVQGSSRGNPGSGSEQVLSQTPFDAGGSQEGNTPNLAEKLWIKLPTWRNRDVKICYKTCSNILFPLDNEDIDESSFYQLLFLEQYTWCKYFQSHLSDRQIFFKVEDDKDSGQKVVCMNVHSDSQEERVDIKHKLCQVVQESGIRVRLIDRHSLACKHILQAKAPPSLSAELVKMYRSHNDDKLILVGRDLEMKEVLTAYGCDMIHSKESTFEESCEISHHEAWLFTSLDLSHFLQHEYHVRCKLFKGEEYVTLIDTGISLKDTKKAAESIVRLLAQVVHEDFYLSEERLNLLQEREAHEYVKKELKKKHIPCGLDIRHKYIQIFSLTQDNFVAARQVIDACLHRHIVSNIPSDNLQELMKIELNCRGKVKIVEKDKSYFTVICTSDISHKIMGIIMSTSTTEMFHLSICEAKMKFLLRHCFEDLKRVEDKHGIKITAMKDGLQVEVNSGISRKEVEKEIGLLCDKFNTNIPVDPSLKDYILSKEGRNCLIQLADENSTHCILPDADDAEENACDNVLCSWYCGMKGQQILLVQGRAADLYVDCLVIPVNGSIIAITPAEHGIQDSVDDEVRKEVLAKITAMRRNFQCAELFIGEKGKLKCKKKPVYLVFTHKNKQISYEELIDKLKEIFQQADAFESESIGLPIEFYDGISENEAKEIIRPVIEAVTQFFKEGHNLTKLYLCTIEKQDIVSRIHAVEKNFKETRSSASKHSVIKESGSESGQMEDEGMSNTVEVSGFSTNTSQELLEMYFENSQRSRGGDIEKVQIRDGVAYITFKGAEVAQRVVSHSNHQLDGQTLTVTLFHPSSPKPSYENRVLVQGLNNAVTEELLTNFLEKMTKTEVREFLYGEEEGKVVVTLSDNIDFVELGKTFKGRSIEGAFLKVARVAISNCIFVHNVQPSTSHDTILFYFESKRKSGGGDVERVEMKTEDGYCLIYFEDHSVIDRVLSQSHKVDGADVEVHLHHECLGQRSSRNRSDPLLRIPSPGNKDSATLEDEKTDNQSDDETSSSISSNPDKESDFVEVREWQENDGKNCTLPLWVQYKRVMKIVKDVKKIPCSWNFYAYWNFYTKTKWGKQMLLEILNKYNCSVAVCTEDEDLFIFEISEKSFEEESDMVNFIDSVLDNVHKHAQEFLCLDTLLVDQRIQGDVLQQVRQRKELDGARIELMGQHDPDAICVVCTEKDKLSVLHMITKTIENARECFENHEEIVSVDHKWQKVLKRFGYLQKLGDKYPSVTIIPDEIKSTIMLKGQQDESKAAADHLKELVGTAQSEVTEDIFSPGCQFDIFTNPEMCDYIDNIIMELSIVWIPNHMTKKIHLFSKKSEKIKGIDELIKGCIKERPYPLPKDQSVLSIEMFRSLEELKKKHKGKIVINSSPKGLVLTTADDIFDIADDVVQKLIDKETVVEVSKVALKGKKEGTLTTAVDGGQSMKTTDKNKDPTKAKTTKTFKG